MSNQQGFNGWFNYETWVVALWLDNDQNRYLLWRENAKQAVIQVLNENCDLCFNEEKLLQRASYILSQQLCDDLEDENPLKDQANAFTDLLNAALDEVNHLEIAKHYLEEDVVNVALQEWDEENASADDEKE